MEKPQSKIQRWETYLFWRWLVKFNFIFKVNYSRLTVPWLHSISLFVRSYMEGSADCKDHVTILWVIFFVIIIIALCECIMCHPLFYSAKCECNFVTIIVNTKLRPPKEYFKTFFNNNKIPPTLLGLAHFKYPWMHSLQDFQIPARQPVIWIFPRSWSSCARAWHLWGIWEICCTICFTLTAIKGRWRTNCTYWQDSIEIKFASHQIFHKYVNHKL